MVFPVLHVPVVTVQPVDEYVFANFCFAEIVLKKLTLNPVVNNEVVLP